MAEPTHVIWHGHTVTRAEREHRFGHRGCVVWFTGLSGCGKSTIANAVDHHLFQLGVRSYLLDGDNVRHGLNASPELLAQAHGDAFAERFGLTFSPVDREENIRRIGAVAGLFCDAGIVTLTAFVSPYRRDRQRVRESVGEGDFFEVFVDTPLEVCESRDPKGLYKKARAGEISGFTGIDAPYEPPESCELVLDGAKESVDVLASQVLERLQAAGKIPSSPVDS